VKQTGREAANSPSRTSNATHVPHLISLGGKLYILSYSHFPSKTGGTTD